MNLASGARFGPYEIVAPIGAGGMGEVYRARDTRLGRDVAIKVLPADFAADAERLKRFEREAKATAALSHPNVLAVYDVGTHEGVPYLVEELLEGESLKDRLAQGAVPVREAVEIAVQVAHGLAAAHGKHIVHRDLKPANVFITSEGTAKILDFGIAKLVESVPVGEADTLTHAPTGATELGRVLGTTAYMSPEQARGMPVDPRSDIFSLGVVLYEMLAGQRPFRGETATDTVAAILTQEPPPLPEGVAPALQSVVTQCLAKRPDLRFSSAHDLALALQSASSQGGTAPVGVTGVGVAGLARRRRLLLAGGVLFAGAIVASLAIWRPWHAVSEPAGTGPGHLPSILALPCKVYGAPEVAFLTDAVPGTISTLLAQVEGLDTKVPPTSFEVEKVKGDLATLADLYQVSSFIVTSISTSAGGFALNVQLVDAATRKVRWGKQYEGPREAYNDLARQAAEGIRLAVKPAASPVPTTSVSAEAELALREGDYFDKRYGDLRHSADFDSSLAALKRALQLDPSLNVARAHIAALYIRKFETEGEASGALKEAEAWARRALEVDQRSGRAWEVLSWVEMYSTKPDIERQLEYALKAASVSPRDAESHMTVSNSVQNPGAFSLNLAAALWAVDVDPFYLSGSGNVVIALSALGRPEEALPFADRIVRVEPDSWLVPDTKGYVLLKLGRLDEARKFMTRGEPQFFENPSTFVSQLWGQIRFELAVAERDAATVKKLERYILPQLLDGRADSLTLQCGTQFVCPGLALLGRTDESIRILLRSVEVGVPPPYDWVLLDPDIQLLRSDPRFAKVLTASRDGAARIGKILEAARTRGELPSYLNQPLDNLIKLLNEKGGTS
jgi:tetratricopeptide (TPR) repeat protein